MGNQSPAKSSTQLNLDRKARDKKNEGRERGRKEKAEEARKEGRVLSLLALKRNSVCWA